MSRYQHKQLNLAVFYKLNRLFHFPSDCWPFEVRPFFKMLPAAADIMPQAKYRCSSPPSTGHTTKRRTVLPLITADVIKIFFPSLIKLLTALFTSFEPWNREIIPTQTLHSAFLFPTLTNDCNEGMFSLHELTLTQNVTRPSLCPRSSNLSSANTKVVNNSACPVVYKETRTKYIYIHN